MQGLWNVWLTEDEVGEEFRRGRERQALSFCDANGRASRGWYVSEAPALLPHPAAGRSANTMAGAVTPSMH